VYVCTAEKLVPPKVFVETSCNCALKCNETVPKEKRERIFKDFYSLNRDLKSAFITTHGEVVTKKRNYTKGLMSRRNSTRINKLPSFDKAEESVVCETFFKQTLQIRDRKIHKTLKKKQHSGGPVSNKFKSSDDVEDTDVLVDS
jgi:hypothetical protein